jgi:hypothetical protein
MLQAFIDDSRTGHVGSPGGIFVLAGYIAAVPEWLNFNKQWQTVLDLPPKWEAFKMSQARHHYGTLANERLRQFHEVIENNVRGAVVASVDLDAYYQFFGAPTDKKKPLRNPYYVLLIDLVIQLKRILPHMELDDDKIEFIFDEQMTEKVAIQESWVGIAKTRPDIAAHLGNEPKWEKEEEFLPLQAADKIAWWARRHMEESRAGKPLTPIPWREKRLIATLKLHLGEENLKLIMAKKRW